MTTRKETVPKRSAAATSALAQSSAEACAKENAGSLREHSMDETGVQTPTSPTNFGLGIREVLAWLFDNIKLADIKWCPSVIGTSGSGPWPIVEFDEFLASLGFTPAHLPRWELRCIVLGTANWEKDALIDQIDGRDGTDLIVLSQPMLIAGLLKNANPLETMGADRLLSIAESHPALNFLLNYGFDWCYEIRLDAVSMWEPTLELAADSPLLLAGYNVAKDGPDEAERHDLLETFFFDRFPRGLELPADRKRWGPARSAQRLYAMAMFINWLARRQGAGNQHAVARWQQDLVWLEQELFHPTMQFEWPARSQSNRKRESPSGNPDAKAARYSAKPASSASGRYLTSKLGPKRLEPAEAWPFPNGSEPLVSSPTKEKDRRQLDPAAAWPFPSEPDPSASSSTKENGRRQLDPAAAWPWSTENKP